MTEPAKDEAELLDALVDAIWQYLAPETRWTAKPYVERDLRAAIRAAGWAVVPGWQPIETAPKDSVVLLFCPDRGITNRERIELGEAVSTFGRERGWSRHAWATAWMPLPAAPEVKP